MAEPGDERTLVVQQVLMGEQDAARRARRAGGVLNERDRLRAHFRLAPLCRLVIGDLIGGQPPHTGQLGNLRTQRRRIRDHPPRREHHLDLGVRDHPAQPPQRTVLPFRQRRGHGNHTRCEAAEERFGKLRASRVQQQRPLRKPLLQSGRDRPSAGTQARVRDLADDTVDVTAVQEPVHQIGRPLLDLGEQGVDESVVHELLPLTVEPEFGRSWSPDLRGVAHGAL
ncbi:hypothetical protein NN4_32190 [Nocardia ninae NBRC 108245]|uniref:Uncharacterized protein n=1 Tax=Nocardia ninae NBRC 108245 TaxID=1210091 RepID=A0A511MDH5_9NOCA|nr:hypothetical protein NN4_32190 [Nocardia ninae NBRC 108245]